MERKRNNSQTNGKQESPERELNEIEASNLTDGNEEGGKPG